MRVLYGAVVMDRETCPDCGEDAWVQGGKMACCGAKVQRQTSGIRREGGASRIRRRPAPEEAKQMLAIQHNRCFYCGTVFGDVAKREGTSRLLTVCWDHVEPFAWQSNNQLLNFVAACSICNGIKGSKMFQSMQEAIEYVWLARKRKGWTTATQESPDSPMRGLWRAVQNLQGASDVLHKQVS